MNTPEADPTTLLTIEDDDAVRRSIAAYFEDSGFVALEAVDGLEGLEVFRSEQPNLVLTDLRMPRLDGLGVIAALRAESPDTPIIVVSGTGKLEDAIEAVRRGAWDYVTKPILDMAALELTVRRALERARLLRENRAYQEHLEQLVQERTAELRNANERLHLELTERKRAELELTNAYKEIAQLKEKVEAENIYLREEIRMEHGFKNIIGKGPELQQVLFRVGQVAPTDTTVLILGETGTGKGLVAHAIHDMSARKQHAFITVNCAALAANLIESELFGREKGAFTGAHTRQLGRFEIANHGTIFLDEIGELSFELQSKLLAVIQEGEFQRLGSPHTIRVDVRIIASTNRSLSEDVRNGRFREDLYYRLNVFPITIPPLRQRREDVAVLVHHFVNKYAQKIGKTITSIPKETMDRLENYDWPGNVRELEHVIERAVITTTGPSLRLAERIEAGPALRSEEGSFLSLEQMERTYISKVLEQTWWRIEGRDGAAAVLGLSPSTLRSRMQRLKIHRPTKKTG